MLGENMSTQCKYNQCHWVSKLVKWSISTGIYHVLNVLFIFKHIDGEFVGELVGACVGEFVGEYVGIVSKIWYWYESRYW